MNVARDLAVWVCLLLLTACSSIAGKRKPSQEAAHVEPISPHVVHPSRQSSCSVEGEECNCEGSCVWDAPNHSGLHYSLIELCAKDFDSKLQNPRGASLRISPCGLVNCAADTDRGRHDGAKGCISVPGVKPTVTGRTSFVRLLVDGVPSSGFQLVFDEGDKCEVTGKPRQTIITFPCDPTERIPADSLKPVKAYEGENKEICHYNLLFPSSTFGCPLHRHYSSLVASESANSPVVINAVSGCVDSNPIKTTSNCLPNGKQLVTIHTQGIHTMCPEHLEDKNINTNERNELQMDTKRCSDYVRSNYCVYVGDAALCTQLAVKSVFDLTCVLGIAEGVDLSVSIHKLVLNGGKEECQRDSVLAEMRNAVSFKKTINFKEKFSRFVEYGVGGLNREIDELYRRAFASRGVSDELLGKLGVTHIKGILLHGPPGTGKTLLARTIAKILGSTQVQLINGPEIISKYLGESERNLRGYFNSAHESFQKHGHASDLYVIIIDEIDAICKPRGKSDQSAAGVAYDSLVNQLLTLMDGLSEVSNVLVVGMTNRKELMDPALLRPGRFEVQIELKLPDEQGRLEIFEIHTRAMKQSGLLSDDVSLDELAANTTGYSGAEIAGCVRAASSYALERQPPSDGDEASVKSVAVTSSDFRRAFESISPAYTLSESVISAQFLPTVFHHLGTEHERVITTLLDIARSIHHSAYGRIQSVLLYGPRGTGKTSLAAQIAVIGQFKLVKMITAGTVIGLPDIQKVDYIKQTFTDAMKVKTSLIVLDDLHRLLEYVHIGSQVSVSHAMMHAITTMLSTPPSPTTSMLVIGTITANSVDELLHQPSGLGLYDLFSWHYKVPPMDPTAVTEFLNIKQILKSDGSGRLIPPRHIHTITIKQLLQALECSSRDSSQRQTHHSITVDQNRFNQCLTTVLSISSVNRDQSVPKAYHE